MIEQLRPYPTGRDLAQLYAHPNDGDRWLEHSIRIDVTVDLARHRFPKRDLIIDPAAGAGRTARELIDGAGRIITGDLAEDADVDYPGVFAEVLLEECAHRYGVGAADLIILGEILEHVEEPIALLAAAREAGRGLVLSTPLDEPAGVNPEHIWRWDKTGIIELLTAADWNPLDYVELDVDLPHWPAGFRCQIHTAEALR